jgi:hypothetical protein
MPTIPFTEFLRSEVGKYFEDNYLLIDREPFLAIIKLNPIVQQMIQTDMYKDIEKDCLSFAAVATIKNRRKVVLVQMDILESLCHGVRGDRGLVSEYIQAVAAHEKTHLTQEPLAKYDLQSVSSCETCANTEEIDAVTARFANLSTVYKRVYKRMKKEGA